MSDQMILKSRKFTVEVDGKWVGLPASLYNPALTSKHGLNFAICALVPPWHDDNEKLVRNAFEHLFVYYPHNDDCEKPVIPWEKK